MTLITIRCRAVSWEQFTKVNDGFRAEEFRRLGLTGGSGDWERLVRGVIREFEENNSGVDLFHFDSGEDADGRQNRPAAFCRKILPA